MDIIENYDRNILKSLNIIYFKLYYLKYIIIVVVIIIILIAVFIWSFTIFFIKKFSTFN